VIEQDVPAVAAAVREGSLSAVSLAEHALSLAEHDELGSFTAVLASRALADARRVDACVAAGEDPGPLAGVPFAVKNLFDVAGEVTLAGSAINAANPPAVADADAVARMTAAGAVLVGQLNMDEYAYGFTTENHHHGPCRNPHDRDRVAGGSSGGSASAVAAGIVPLALGSDTNGSIRVPAALCGVYGLRPTPGGVSRRGIAPFSDTLDAVAVAASTVAGVAAALEALNPGATRPRASPRPLRVAVAEGYFARGGAPEAIAAVESLAAALGAGARVELRGAAQARAAAMLITAAEGAEEHIADLRARPQDFDPMTRDRFLAGALLPAGAYLAAQAFRARFSAQARALFETVDVVLAPTTPFPAPRIGQREELVDGAPVPTQSYLGVYTQPLSFAGLPVLTVPVATDGLPLGVQLVAAPHADATLLALAARLESDGLTAARIRLGSGDGGELG
jgi:aspartyl-tRNA(Asn)/glutamyl-tRNA(Gln) amidotransferase subunit A